MPVPRSGKVPARAPQVPRLLATSQPTTHTLIQTRIHPHEDRYMMTEEAAAFTGIALATLNSWRSKGLGPRYNKIGARSVRYRLSELIAFMEGGKA